MEKERHEEAGSAVEMFALMRNRSRHPHCVEIQLLPHDSQTVSLRTLVLFDKAMWSQLKPVSSSKKMQRKRMARNSE